MTRRFQQFRSKKCSMTDLVTCFPALNAGCKYFMQVSFLWKSLYMRSSNMWQLIYSPSYNHCSRDDHAIDHPDDFARSIIFLAKRKNYHPRILPDGFTRLALLLVRMNDNAAASSAGQMNRALQTKARMKLRARSGSMKIVSFFITLKTERERQCLFKLKK